ncbi:MAG: response regulator [Clostridia bacterium]|nr:response regulator [Clostridia bacterium]
MPEQKKILIVDDEKEIVNLLTLNLQKEGYIIIDAFDGEYGYQRAINENPDLILLDVMLPKMDGLTVCKKIREKSNVPIIMLTAKEDVVDKILGIEMGADDYITKPYNTREVIARVKANLRKMDGINSVIAQNVQNNEEKIFYDFGILTIDFNKYEVKVRGVEVDLTLKEYELLKFLILHKGQVFKREELLEKVWGYNYYGDVRTVDVTIRRIREKIESDSSNPELILTKRSLGYYFNGNLEQK